MILLRRLHGPLLGVLVLLPTGVGTELGRADAAEPLAADAAVVPGGLSQGAEGCGYLALVHAALYAGSGSVSKLRLDTVAALCYNGLVG